MVIIMSPRAYRYDLHLPYLPGKFFSAMNRGTGRLAARWTRTGAQSLMSAMN
jgi:hypothetical protein